MNNIIFFLIFLSWIVPSDNIATATRVPFTSAMEKNDIEIINRFGIDLTSRLETSGGVVECWTALLELKSCSNEIVLFFLNGQTDIGGDCCRAIVFITRSCWPAMLTSLGFTVEEGDVLRGYCDAIEAHTPPLPPSLGPSPAPYAERPPVADDLAKLPSLLD